MFRRPPQQHHRSERPARPSRPTLAAVVALCVGVLVLAACTGDGGAEPDSTSPTSFTLSGIDGGGDLRTVTLPEDFVLVDARGTRIQPFESKATSSRPPLDVYGGTASISGRVTGPEGPVAGATVLIERVVGDRSGTATVVADGAGSYQAQGVHGGKYRVRAWLAPTLASRSSSLAYVVAVDGRATVDLSLEAFTGRSLQVGLDIAALNVGDTAHVRALLTDQVVSDRGVVVGQPISSVEVVLSGSGSLQYGTATATTSSQGIASWEVTCTREGSTTFTASAEGVTDSFTSPSCGPKPTTTTSGPDAPDFPVGQDFDVPHSGALPAGTYTTFLDGCKTTYQVYANGAWLDERRTATDTIVLSGPGRDFRPADGSLGCTYRRES